jgi:hypothetical protein
LVREELLYQDGKKLDHYLVGLPAECDWKIGLNSIPIEEADWAKTKVKAQDTISIVAIPRGGGGGSYRCYWWLLNQPSYPSRWIKE